MEIYRVGIEIYWVLFVGTVGISQKLFSPECWGCGEPLAV